MTASFRTRKNDRRGDAYGSYDDDGDDDDCRGNDDVGDDADLNRWPALVRTSPIPSTACDAPSSSCVMV